TKPSKPAQRHIRHLAQLGTLPPELLDQLNRIIKRAMAMKQRDRYPTVAEFRSDLRKVLEALPTPPNPSQRPVDPNSTQPDLPMLYEALEAAKAAANQPVQTKSQPAEIINCSRCGASLVKQAAFCPSCGSAINSVIKGNPVNPAGPKDVSSNRDMAQNQPIARASSFDSTMISKPQAQAQVQTSHKPPTPKPEAKSTTISSARAENKVSAPTMTQVQVKPPPGTTSQARPPTSTPVNNTPANSNGFSKQMKLLIIAIVIVVVLLLIMIVALFLINQGHHSQAIHYLMSWYTPRMY
ncbi:MAG TPA: hypothetical protein VK667_04760, partial [Ktedonobacteraceae bacterium]|nr:hypothetical protein [Ktedonobacteraceae bacterium]